MNWILAYRVEEGKCVHFQFFQPGEIPEDYWAVIGTELEPVEKSWTVSLLPKEPQP